MVFADDSQLWISFKPDSQSNQENAFEAVQHCIIDVKKLMSYKKLKMNDEKTEFLLIGTNQQLKKIEQSPIPIGTELIYSVKNARYLGGWIDENISLNVTFPKRVVLLIITSETSAGLESFYI